MQRKARPRPVIGPINIYGLLALAGIVGPFVLAIGDITAGSSNPDYDLVRDSISSLALTPMGWLQTIGFLAIGLLMEIFVAGLLFNIRRGRGFSFSAGLLVFFGFGLLLIGAFRTDPTGATHTVEGTIHSATATTVFWIFPIAILVLAPSLRKDPRWKGLFHYTIITAVVCVLLMLMRIWLPDELSWFGLYERILVAVMVIWVEVMAIQLLHLSLRTARKIKETKLPEDSIPNGV